MKKTVCALIIALVGVGCTKTPTPLPAGGDAKLKALYLSSEKTSAVVGEPLQLKVIANIADGVVNHTDACTFSSSDEEVAVMLPGGKVNGLKAGKVTITAEKDGIKSKPLDIEVVAAPSSSG